MADPLVDTWDAGYQGPIHGMILMAFGEPSRAVLDQWVRDIVQRLHRKNEERQKRVLVLCVEGGDAIQNADGQDIEHFGYVDGISQPTFFLEEMAGTGRTH